jgi:hypothetical protein
MCAALEPRQETAAVEHTSRKFDPLIVLISGWERACTDTNSTPAHHCDLQLTPQRTTMHHRCTQHASTAKHTARHHCRTTSTASACIPASAANVPMLGISQPRKTRQGAIHQQRQGSTCSCDEMASGNTQQATHFNLLQQRNLRIPC